MEVKIGAFVDGVSNVIKERVMVFGKVNLSEYI